jgi:hypothetical protein
VSQTSLEKRVRSSSSHASSVTFEHAVRNDLDMRV